MNTRIFIQKKPSFQQKEQSLLEELQQYFSIKSLSIKIIYDIFNIDEKDLDNAIQQIFSNPVTDECLTTYTPTQPYIATEYLPGQFNQRADSAEQCLRMLGIENVSIKTGILYEFEGISSAEIDAICNILINPIEMRIKDLTQLELPQSPQPKPVPIIENFTVATAEQLNILHQDFGFSFGLDDLEFIQHYFQKINRNPTETELRVLDTYWSDHCRHTTFETEITSVEFATQFQNTIQNTYNYYLQLREELGIKKPIRLMDLATIIAKYFIKNEQVTNIDISDEINACSIVVSVDEDGKTEDWLLQFKNETHNHPTEVEPYGGASTCIGGAIRDPLSGRAYVYQAMRVTGSANPLEKRENTLKGKLPQKKITQEAAHGYSAYGNQIGVATTLVKEIYDDGYKAKRMEVGFVAGAVRKDWVRREKPKAGDVVIILGGKTGRDGIGGATGSSKVHDGKQLSEMSSEVQKGNAPEERKIQRLFRQKEVLQMIKKCNDFGAGGVAVAIGEIAEGIRINLDIITTKYDGLNGTELTISESQERMAVVVSAEDATQFIKKAQEENIEAVIVAEVTQEPVMQIVWQGKTIVELERSFLDSNGIRKQTEVCITDGKTQNPFKKQDFTQENFKKLLQDLNHTSQKGLHEMFDYNVGRSSVLAPLGGQLQLSPEDVSVQKFPTQGFTNTVSMASFGFNPAISKWSCFHGGYYAVMDSVCKIVAAGGNYADIRLSFQEYFERLKEDKTRWGKPFTALLGTIEAQRILGIPAIGGKDSMSGSYQDLDVPPTLISFAVAPNQVKNIRSATFEQSDSYIYILHPQLTTDFLIDTESLTACFNYLREKIQHTKHILSAKTTTYGGLAETLTLMALGNQIGFQINTNLELMQYLPASIVIESNAELSFEYLHYLGKTNNSDTIQFNEETFDLKEITTLYTQTLEPIFPSKETFNKPQVVNSVKDSIVKEKTIVNYRPKVLIPVFLGTNSEYDSQKAFEREGAEVTQILIRNLKKDWLHESINELVAEIAKTDILFIPGGFSAADEPEGSGKYIATLLRNPEVTDAIHHFLDRKGLILGICNGFQGLIQSGLLPYGRVCKPDENAPILYYNEIGRHVTQMVRTQVIEDQSPWLRGMKGKTFWMPISHGEGRLLLNNNTLQELIQNKQIATQYVDLQNNIAVERPWNPNGSTQAIEGITSPCGQIYGRMGHPERVEEGTFINIPQVEIMNIFRNAVTFVQELKM